MRVEGVGYSYQDITKFNASLFTLTEELVWPNEVETVPGELRRSFVIDNGGLAEINSVELAIESLVLVWHQSIRYWHRSLSRRARGKTVTLIFQKLLCRV